MRYAIMIVIGLLIGVVGTAFAMNSLNQGPHLDKSVMHMMDFHMDGLHTAIDQNHCAVTDTLPHIQALRALSNDIDPIFAKEITDARFNQNASTLRASIDTVLANAPTDCAAVGAAMTRIGKSCKGCHQQFKD
ncbi:MAG: cytochrome c [Lysobacteraceae bacterium]